MPKISTLTSEQAALLAEFERDWTHHATSCEPANRTRAEEGVRLAYAAVGYPPPRKIVWCGSPRSGSMARALLLNLAPDDIGANLHRAMWGGLRSRALAAIGSRIESEVWDQINSCLENPVETITDRLTRLLGGRAHFTARSKTPRSSNHLGPRVSCSLGQRMVMRRRFRG